MSTGHAPAGRDTAHLAGLAPARIVAATALSACGRTYGYRCTDQVCTASFQGPGELDLADARGPLVEVAAIGDGPSVTVADHARGDVGVLPT